MSAANKRRNVPPSADAAAERFLTPTQVAQRLLVAPVTVRLWASKGMLPAVTTPGGHRRFREADIEQFVAQHQRAGRVAGAAPARVLIIDDDVQYARYLSTMLARQAPQATIEVAHDGFTAGVKCEALRPDLVTLDLHMPDLDGFEVCARLRSRFAKGLLRIIALSGFASQDNVHRILAAGADACLAKTTPAPQLLRELGFAHGATA
jgi:excisionase family DNA binding protein